MMDLPREEVTVLIRHCAFCPGAPLSPLVGLADGSRISETSAFVAHTEDGRQVGGCSGRMRTHARQALQALSAHP